jgi:hypothetical protein
MKTKKQKNQESTREAIEYNLKKYGYPFLPAPKHQQEKIPLEELIILIITQFPKEEYVKAIPFLIIKNNVNTLLLLDLASKHGIKNKVGYLIEAACFLINHPYLPMLLSYLRNHKDPEVSTLIPGDKAFLKKTTLYREQKWNLQGGLLSKELKKIANQLGIKEDKYECNLPP